MKKKSVTCIDAIFIFFETALQTIGFLGWWGRGGDPCAQNVYEIGERPNGYICAL